jgi:hypothetical protein
LNLEDLGWGEPFASGFARAADRDGCAPAAIVAATRRRAGRCARCPAIGACWSTRRAGDLDPARLRHHRKLEHEQRRAASRGSETRSTTRDRRRRSGS